MAQGFGSGLVPFAPGTWGSFAGWLLFVLVGAPYPPLPTFAVLLALFALGVLVSERTGRDLGVADHGSIVFDEMVAVWCVLEFLPPVWTWQLAGVLVFRVFDILKPPPIRTLEARYHGGFGVMIDDVAAAFATLIVLALAKRVMGLW